MSLQGLILLCSSLLALAACEQKAAGGSTDGKTLYQELCSRCHGPGGKPTKAMVARTGVRDLTSARVQEQLSAENIRTQILRGSSNRQMPAFQGAVSDEQLDALVAYVQSLDGETATAPAPAEKPAAN